MVIVGGAAIPLAQSSVDRTRAAAAAHYVAGRVAMARFEAVRRSAYVAIQFVQQPDGYRLQSYVDGNRNGVLARESRVASISQSAPPNSSNITSAASNSAFIRASRESIPARSTLLIRFKSAARRCSASAPLERRRQGRCSCMAVSATSSLSGYWVPPRGRASSSSTSPPAHGCPGKARTARRAAGLRLCYPGHGASASAPWAPRTRHRPVVGRRPY